MRLRLIFLCILPATSLLSTILNLLDFDRVPPDTRDHLGAILTIASLIACPFFFVFAPAPKKKKYKDWERTFMSFFATLFFHFVIFMGISMPAAFDRAEAQGNDIYDGVGANVAMMCGGWIFPFLATAFCMAFKSGIDARRERTEQ